MRALWRGANGLWVVLFLGFAGLQANDPDPAPWMALYVGAALACGMEASGQQRWPLAALVAVAALVWASFWMPRVLGQVDWGQAFAHAGMTGDAKEEEARELGGLLLVGTWCALLALAHLLRARTVAPAT